jgi:hypothetical protein
LPGYDFQLKFTSPLQILSVANWLLIKLWLLQGLLCLGRIKRNRLKKRNWRAQAQKDLEVKPNILHDIAYCGKELYVWRCCQCKLTRIEYSLLCIKLCWFCCLRTRTIFIEKGEFNFVLFSMKSMNYICKPVFL